MPKTPSARREIRADFDRETIVVYQAFSNSIADAALKAGRFVPPFSTGRMTWIKPSFLWLMERSNWGTKSNQERILAVRITRAGWEQALSAAVLTNYEKSAHASPEIWRRQLDAAAVHVQWDPDRSLRGASLPQEAIQIGVGRALIEKFVEEWTREIRDMTPLVRKLKKQISEGSASKAQSALPTEKVYGLTADDLKRTLGMYA